MYKAQLAAKSNRVRVKLQLKVNGVEESFEVTDILPKVHLELAMFCAVKCRGGISVKFVYLAVSVFSLTCLGLYASVRHCMTAWVVRTINAG